MTPRMEPRIASLLGDPTTSFLLDPPLLSQSTHVDQNQARLSDALPRIQLPSPKRRTGRTIPLTEVLNFDGDGNKGTNGEGNNGVGGFSGRLGDILLDEDGNSGPRKKRRIETGSVSASTTAITASGIEITSGSLGRSAEYPSNHSVTHENASNHGTGSVAVVGNMASVLNNDLMLPKPHPPPLRKKGRRPRIPPLLQGLHQPPPDAGLFPPITGERAVASPRVVEGVEEKQFSEAIGVRDRREDNSLRDIGNPNDEKANQDNNSREQDQHVDKDKDKDKDVEKRGARKRNKWTDRETIDLLHGVSRFGIGSWKKVLDCAEYSFPGRTSVDLKDRFRTCCPDEYIKFRASDKANGKKKTKSTISNKISIESLASSNPSRYSPTQALNKRATRKPRSGTHRKGRQELAEMGIDQPFEKSRRRERHEFTEKDDNALMRGFEKHGSVWHAIQSDAELGFDSRKPSDLRDRFRTRFPETYMKAGFKLKPAEKKQKNPSSEPRGAATEKPTANDASKPASNIDSSLLSIQPSLPTTTVSTTITKPLAPLQTAFPSTFGDFTSDLPGDSEAEDDAAYSPITLSRNILQFQWGDTNPPQASITAANTTAGITSHLNFHALSGMDQIHIDPLATLKLPPASSASSSYHSFSTSVPPTNPTITSLIHSSYGSGGKSQQGQNYSTNLPNLVFPPPAQGSGRASGSVVNLPPPADLLSGLDLDGRSSMGFSMDTQSSTFLWDESLGTSEFVTGNRNGGLASTGAGGNTIGGVAVNGSATTQVRGLFESDGLGERSLLNSSI